MQDETEEYRRSTTAAINAAAADRATLEARHGKGNVYDGDELRELFEVDAFAAPFVCVIRRSDGKRGSLAFQHRPRFYFNFQES
ncbi:MAG: hypothetical protein ACYTG0_33435 [Planctomycetota bacterium]|jgi:hypothetical protein